MKCVELRAIIEKAAYLGMAAGWGAVQRCDLRETEGAEEARPRIKSIESCHGQVSRLATKPLVGVSISQLPR